MQLSRYNNIVVEKNFEGMKLDKFLFSIFSNINNSSLQKALRNKDILINGFSVAYNYILKNGDNLNISHFISKIFNQPKRAKLPKKKITLKDSEIAKISEYIIYKDDSILAINKPAGLAVQSGTKIEKSLNDYLPYLKFEKSENPRLVHRLDKDTSGIIVVARNKNDAELLAEFFKNKDENLEKIYLAIAVGKFQQESGVINFPLLKKVENGVEKVYRDLIDGKEAVTSYKVLGYSEKYNVSLVELKLLTGRTHQIRVHLKEIGHPILGDGKYGGKKAFVEGLSNDMQLHSYRLNINNFHERNTNLKAELPEKMKTVLKKAGIKFRI